MSQPTGNALKSILRKIVPRSLRDRIHLSRVRKAVSRFSPYVTERTYSGCRRKIHISDGLGQGWYDHDWPELPEVALLKSGKLRAGAKVFDCGAHQSVVALILADVVGPTGKVIAVEGSEHNAEISVKNIELNSCSSVTVLHAAISDSKGQIQFMDELNGSVAEHGVGTWVDAINIDELTNRFGPPDVLFIDIEGYEGHALKGATETLKSLPDCYVEVHLGYGLERAGGSAKQIASFFDRSKYDLYYWISDKDKPQLLVNLESLPSVKFCLVALSKKQQN